MSEPRRGIVLCGFMGTGKTTVGRLLADQLALPFVDLDAELEARFAQPIARVFASLGEAAFREAEHALCAELADDPLPRIIATGGGAVLRCSNRDLLARAGRLVLLRARPETLLERLRADATRPLLQGSEDVATRIAELLEARCAAYASLPLAVDTDGRTPGEVAAAVRAALCGTASNQNQPPRERER